MAKTATKKKHAGRPRSRSPRPVILAFRADEQVVAAVERLAAALAVDFPGIASGGARSIAIRRALLAAAAALDVEDGE